MKKEMYFIKKLEWKKVTSDLIKVNRYSEKDIYYIDEPELISVISYNLDELVNKRYSVWVDIKLSSLLSEQTSKREYFNKISNCKKFVFVFWKSKIEKYLDKAISLNQ